MSKGSKKLLIEHDQIMKSNVLKENKRASSNLSTAVNAISHRGPKNKPLSPENSLSDKKNDSSKVLITDSSHEMCEYKPGYRSPGRQDDSFEFQPTIPEKYKNRFKLPSHSTISLKQEPKFDFYEKKERSIESHKEIKLPPAIVSNL